MLIALVLPIGLDGRTDGSQNFKVTLAHITLFENEGLTKTVLNAERPGPVGPGRSLVVVLHRLGACGPSPYGWMTSRSV
jgi:hypothetical protein